jgi:uncharacterized protein (TIGR00661 family)
MQSANSSPPILIAPLNWGLGHASRCVPIIECLLELGALPILASDGDALALLREAFPDLPSTQLPSYRIRYGKKGHWTRLLGLLPRISKAAWLEHQALKKLVPEYGIQGIISDNRLGCWHTGLPAVYITHQLQLPLPTPWVGRMGDRIHHWFIHRFNHCWVPDLPPPRNLSGQLSQGAPQLQPTFIGPLSRLRFSSSARGHFPIVAVLSGPEPQRTQLETDLITQLKKIDSPVLLVAGQPQSTRKQQTGNITIEGFLGGEALAKALSQAEVIICRSGYSTLMDLYHLQKKAILIPTPGQPEQEVLAQRFTQEGWLPSLSQSDLHELPTHLKSLDQWKGIPQPPESSPSLRVAVEQFLQEVQRNVR